MRWICRHLCLLFLLLPALSVAGVNLVVEGVQGKLKTAVANGSELSHYATGEVSEARLEHLCDRADAQVGAILRRHGHYQAHAACRIQSTAKGWLVRLRVESGPPVLVEAVELQLDRAAAQLPAVKAAKSAVENLLHKQLDEDAYREARDGVTRALTDSGYLDARSDLHRVEVHRGKRQAVIRLAWEVGKRYRFGDLHVEGSLWRPSLFDHIKPFKRGDYFDQNQLLDMQRTLNAVDYFSAAELDTQPNIEQGTVDIAIRLVPNKRSVYSGGPLLGTDAGLGVRGGIEKRWVNAYGHKWKTEAVLAQRMDRLQSEYVIPLLGANEQSLRFFAIEKGEHTSAWSEHNSMFGVQESSRWGDWTRTISIRNLSSRYRLDLKLSDPWNTSISLRDRTSLTYAEASFERKQVDDVNFVRRGWRLHIMARSTAGSLLSSARYSDIYSEASWIHAFGERHRLILRGALGHLWTSDPSKLPPELRYYAGGDSSIRGYSFESQGPMNASGYLVGGHSLAIASATLEHYFNPHWGIAGFVDAGNAFDNLDLRPKIGAGLGVRWRSPLGLIRVDVGAPIHDRHQHGVRLHLAVGPEL